MILTHNELIKKKNGEFITYPELLNTIEWKEKREVILKRDEYYCTKCGLAETFCHNGILLSFDKNKKLDVWDRGQHIVADHVFKSERKIELHIHHKFYILNHLPWEYSEEDLVTLCNWCHHKLHQTENIKVYIQRDSKFFELNYTPCQRCNGAGFLLEYTHVQNGICFDCNGFKYKEISKNYNVEIRRTII